jgi:hypothetical protein
MTLSQVEAMVKSGVLAIIDYRAAATREGYAPEAVIALELQLRWELDKQKSIEDHRLDVEHERAAAKAARDAAALARKAAADAKLALQRRGNASDLEAAYVRGLVPIDQVRTLYDALYDDDVVGTLVELLQAKRADYVAQLAAAEKARQRAAVRGVDVGALETAVMAGVLDVGQFRQRLGDLGFAAADADLLVATLQAKIAARDETERTRDAAAAAAKVRHVDLSTVELLVRRGHRSMADYRALLASLGFDDAAIAAMAERLQILIDDDATAAEARKAAAAKLAARGLSLDQARRAVLLGLKTTTDYGSFLVGQGFKSDDVALLVAELQADLDEAAAARQRRANADRLSQAGKAPLADVRRAARLGLISLDAYTARLRAAGYDDDAVDVETDLLVTEIADDAARRAAAAAADARAAVKGLTLAQLAAAVKANTAPIADYFARAVEIGLSTDDAQLLADTLQAEIDARAAAKQRSADLANAAPERELSRADVAKSVKQGLQTMDAYQAWLLANGYDDDDAALLVAELETDLGGAADTGS